MAATTRARPRAPIRLRNVKSPIPDPMDGMCPSANHWVRGAFAVTYTPKWESLSAAADRLAKTSGCSQDQARSAICQAISDGVIKVRGKLARHDIRSLKSTYVVCGNHLEIPTGLKPDDFDWLNSRPVKPWFLRNIQGLHHGPWHLAYIELFGPDREKHLLSNIEPTVGPTAPQSEKQPKRKRRENPKLKVAKIANDALWPNGPPPTHELPNALLDRHVNTWLKENGLPEVSRDTVLRAAGRRK